MRTITTILALTLILALSADSPAQKPAPTGAPAVTAKGKLPTGWSTGLKLSKFQKEQMLTESAKFQQKIADIRDDEYKTLHRFLDPTQKALLMKKAQPE